MDSESPDPHLYLESGFLSPLPLLPESGPLDEPLLLNLRILLLLESRVTTPYPSFLEGPPLPLLRAYA